MSCGRDSRWSPSLISEKTTSSPLSAWASSRAWRQGTSGSAPPCRMRTGTSIGPGSAPTIVQHRQRILPPAGDRSLGLEVAAGIPVAEIVEAEERAAYRLRPVSQRLGLRARHVGAEPAQPHYRGTTAFNPPPGDMLAIWAAKFSGAL